ncbi:MAG: hypothetical protein ACYS0I_20905, partial [Planctomycetota bacterium]
EDKAIRKRAEKKLKEKNLDMIIANRPAVIGAEKASVEAKIAGCKWLKIPLASKTTISKKIISLTEKVSKIAK